MSVEKASEPKLKIGVFRMKYLVAPIPEASESLKHALAECNASMDEVDRFKVSKRSEYRRVKGNRRLNGFMAFRIYYSRAAKDSASQKKLSALLAKAWKNDNNKHIWSTYASMYNETGGEDAFIFWLEKSLSTHGKTKQTQITRKTPPNVFINGVEDIFLG